MTLTRPLPARRDPALTPELERFLARTASLTDEALDHLLPHSRPGTPAPRLAEAMRYAVLPGGKRLRPALTFLGFHAAAGRGQRALPAAVAVELAHAFSLVHDDLPCLDDSPTRRGQPSVHRRFDEALALLAGDALLALAFELLADRRRSWDPGTGARMVSVLAQALGRHGMIGGQAAEQELLPRALSPRALARVHALKTGRLFEAAVVLGGLAAGAPASGLDQLSLYARPLGLAFQIADDLLDAAEDGARTPGTYPGVVGLAKARAALARAEASAVSEAGRFGGRAGRLAADLARYAAGRRR